MKLHRFVLAALLLFGSAGRSPADVLFSTLLQPDNGSGGFNTADVRLATDFLTDATPRTVTGLTAAVVNSSSIATHTVTFNIFTDNGGLPGTLVSGFDAPGSMGPSGNSVTVSSLGINLQPNTKYWVVGQANEELFGSVTWRFNLGQGTDGGPFSTVAGTPMLTTGNAGLVYVPIDSGNFRFSLEGSTAVPEPPTGLALLLTVGSFGTFRWWRQRRVRLHNPPDRGTAS